MMRWRTRYAAIAAAVVILPAAIACTNVSSADLAPAQLASLNVALCPLWIQLAFSLRCCARARERRCNR
jgi:hypothetical protein